MASLIEISKLCIWLFFNVLYLASSGYFVFVGLMLMVGRSQLTAAQIGSTLTVALPLIGLAGLAVILVSIFGFYALAFNSQPGPVKKYALLILATLVLQSVALFLVYGKGNELTAKLIRYDELPKFEMQMDYQLRIAIHETQQKLDCCGLDSYKDYFGEKIGLTPEQKKALIPNSCCGRYAGPTPGSNEHLGECEFEEFSKRNGCGDALVVDYNRLYGGYNYGFGYVRTRFGLLIYDAVQLAAVGLCLILANRMSYLRA